MKMINKLSIAPCTHLLIALLNSVTAQTKKHNWDAVHANINFTVDYLKFSETTGRFTKSLEVLNIQGPIFQTQKCRLPQK
jgi:polyisoprenoid-binding protein YceI